MGDDCAERIRDQYMEVGELDYFSREMNNLKGKMSLVLGEAEYELKIRCYSEEEPSFFHRGNNLHISRDPKDGFYIITDVSIETVFGQQSLDLGNSALSRPAASSWIGDDPVFSHLSIT